MAFQAASVCNWSLIDSRLFGRYRGWKPNCGSRCCWCWGAPSPYTAKSKSQLRQVSIDRYISCRLWCRPDTQIATPRCCCLVGTPRRFPQLVYCLFALRLPIEAFRLSTTYTGGILRATTDRSKVSQFCKTCLYKLPRNQRFSAHALVPRLMMGISFWERERKKVFNPHSFKLYAGSFRGSLMHRRCRNVRLAKWDLLLPKRPLSWRVWTLQPHVWHTHQPVLLPQRR